MVSATTRSATAVSSFGMREGRVLSRSSPSKPSAAKRSCQRQTQVLDLPVSAHDRVRAEPFSAQQYNPGPPDVLLGGVPIVDQETKPIKIGRRDRKGDASSHRPDSHAANRPGIPTGIQMSDLIH